MRGDDAGGVKVVPVIAVVTVGLALTIGTFAFLNTDGDRVPPEDDRHDVDSYPAAVQGLCEASRVAEDDPERAHDLFFDEAHATLHVLADEVAERDRAAAAALLEAKERAESTLSSEDVSSEELRTDLDALVDATIAATRAVDVEVDRCA